MRFHFKIQVISHLSVGAAIPSTGESHTYDLQSKIDANKKIGIKGLFVNEVGEKE
jgi:hypothetical protein